MFSHRRAIPSIDGWRRKLIRETEFAILSGLLHPKQNPRIPTIMIGVGQFDSRWAAQWWESVLELKPLHRANNPESNTALDD